MYSNPLRIAARLLLAFVFVAPLRAVDATWNTPVNGASYAQAGTPNTHSVPFSIDINASAPWGYEMAIYSGTSRLGALGYQGTSGGVRNFAGRISIPSTGSYLLTAKTTDGFDESVFDGPTITVTNTPPPTTYYPEAPTQLTAVSALLNGKVNSHGRGIGWEGSWEIGTTTSYGRFLGGAGVYLEPVRLLSSGQSYVAGLQPATTYHYRFIGSGMVGPDQTFTTQPNNPPLLRDDYGILDPAGVSEIYVLGNDEDETVTYWDLPTPEVEVSIAPQFGTVQRSQTGTFRFRYTAGESFSGSDEFTYLVRDSFGGESTAKVRIYSQRTHSQAVAGQYSSAVLYDNTHLQSLSLSVTRGGALSGMLNYFGAQMPFTGQLRYAEDSGPGAVFIYLPRAGFAPLRLMLGLGFDFYDPTIPSLQAYISDEDFGREIEFPSTPVQVTARDLVLEAGNFNGTMQNPEAGPLESASEGTPSSTTDVGGNPQGHGFSRMRVSKGGSIIVRGKTGDQRPFSSGSTLRKDRKVQLKAKTGTAKKGALLGLVDFHAGQATATGEVRWLNPASSATAGAYLSGFDLKVPLDAKKVEGTADAGGILLFPEGSERLVKVSVGNHRGELIASATMPLVKGKLNNGPGEFRLRVDVNQKTGAFRGSLTTAGKRIPISGVIRPGERKGLGVAGETGLDGPVELQAL
jgi:hypothetical protein